MFIAPGVPLLLAPHTPGLYRPLPTSGGSGSSGESGGSGGGSTSLSSITGLAGWWDASSYAGSTGASGNTAAGWSTAISGVTDKSTSGVALVPFFGAGSGTAPQTTARLNATLGGIGRNTVVPPGSLPSPGQFLPVMDPDQGLRLPTQTFGIDSPWTIFLVWSRPNWRQGASTSPITLLAIGGTPIVQVDSSAGPEGWCCFRSRGRRSSPA
jgi:hypothetical protein